MKFWHVFILLYLFGAIALKNTVGGFTVPLNNAGKWIFMAGIHKIPFFNGAARHAHFREEKGNKYSLVIIIWQIIWLITMMIIPIILKIFWDYMPEYILLKYIYFVNHIELLYLAEAITVILDFFAEKIIYLVKGND
ncbi:MAG: hypothetical protein IKV89_02245 [Clostridia bacterium]|nr:hypothetical protein [Clostridia bacterium]